MVLSTYFHVKFHNVSMAEEELLSQVCFEYGASGVSEELDFQQCRDDYQPELIEKKHKTLNGYFEDRPSEDFFLRLGNDFPAVEVEQSEEENKDWLEEWKKGFTAFQLVGPYWVVPTWLEKPEQAEKPIWIDPGMAFGTGTHATTQMASELLFDLSGSLDSEFSVLDVGTGTGILAFLARIQGAGKVVATEIDEDARRVARENLTINKLQQIEIPEKQVQDIDESFDVVIANIIDGVLLKLKDSVVSRVSAGGNLILSGILIEHEADFLSKFLEGTNLSLLKRIEKDEWLGLLLGKQ